MRKYLVYSTLPVFMLFAACSGNESKEGKESIDEELIDPNSSLNTNFDGKIFSIPSPVQTALLIKSTNLPFDNNLLNPVQNASDYTTEFKQALNLGIYGTDLGYAALYEQKAVSLNYLSVIEKLTGQLGLEGAFDKSFMSRFEKNSGNEDSVMIIVSDAFRKADNYLKSSNRKSTSALILTGGWIESLHYACELNKMKPNAKIKERIGEQKQTLYTIIEILEEYNKGGSNDELIADLNDLRFYFDKVNIDYEFVEPKTDAKNKTTTLQHNISIKIDTDILNQITLKVEDIRDNIIN
ncbi:MAG: hypothetical protein EP305_11975 [Bacteroidetes bacterium]|nr:MAG: hypothetical protein EP305_11975 [Bacteroidota bacterium]